MATQAAEAQDQAQTQAHVDPSKPPAKAAAARNTATDYNDNAQRDPQTLATRDELRAQPKVNVFLQWTAEDEKAFQGNRPLPYRRVETVHINGVEYHIERGKMAQVPLSVAVVLADAGMIAIDQLPDCRDKEVLVAEREKAERERQARYARRGLDLVR